MQKFLLYDTDDGLDFNVSYIPSDLPWVSCKIFRVHDQENVYFEVIKSEEYLETNGLIEKPIGSFKSFQHAAETAEYIACADRVKNRWPTMRRMVQ